jgi:predicted dithiol-disulfide oxidoreductase (DUF899 family)
MTAASDQLHQVRFPGESDEYRSARDALLQAEIELRERTETVAEQRRRLPLGGEVPADYAFTEWDPVTGAPRQVRLSELFDGGKDVLFLYSFMFKPSSDGDPLGSPCPSCTSIIDAVAGQYQHVRERVNLAIAAKVPIERLRAHAYSRGWAEIRMLSSAANSYNADYHAEAEDGSQLPIATVFVCHDGRIHHTWSSELFFAPRAPGQHPRHVEFMWPLWQILDTTPLGRDPDWTPELQYGIAGTLQRS